MPSLGLGTYQLTADACQVAVDYAIGVGYRHIDTAYSYSNEANIGEVIKHKINKQEIKRKDLFLTTKVPPLYLDPKDVEFAAQESIARLGVSYVDMLLIHSPWGVKNHGDGNLSPRNDQGQLDFYQHDHQKAWRAFESLVDKGITKAIGVSNFTSRQIDQIWNVARVKPANVQMECHVHNQQPELRAFCQKKNIVVTGYSPFGSPQRPEKHRLPGDQSILEDAVVMAIAAKHSRSTAQILLQYLLLIGVVPLPKSMTLKRIKENLGCYDISLDHEDITKLARLNRNQKYFSFADRLGHPDYSPDEPF